MVMTATAGIRLFFSPASLYAQLRGNKLKCMAVLMPYRLWHMAGNTAAESMNSVCRSSLECFVTIHTQAVRSKFSHGNFCDLFLMYIVAISTHNSCFRMLALTPFIVLLMVFLFLPRLLTISQIQGFSRQVAVWIAVLLWETFLIWINLRSACTPVVALAADHCAEAPGQFCSVNNSLLLVISVYAGSLNMVAARPVARLTSYAEINPGRIKGIHVFVIVYL